MSAKRKASKMDKHIRTNYRDEEECIGCCFKIDRKSMKKFASHLKTNKCDEVSICKKCSIFRTLSEDMYTEHMEKCTGTLGVKVKKVKKKKKK